MSRKIFDVIIIGGSYSGLSAGMALGRSLRSVLVIDNNTPCNRQTPHSHNFITNDGEKPRDIALKARSEVLRYDTVQFLEDLAIQGEQTSAGFVVKTRSGNEVEAKKMIFATGISDIMPNIPGFADCWGISVIHCPYCHGFEFKGKKTGILANGEKAYHLASLVNNLTDDVIIMTSEEPSFEADQLQKLSSHNINIIENKVAEIEHNDGHLKHVIFSNGEKESFSGVYASLPFIQHSDIPVSLGCELTDNGLIKIDNFQKTNVSGLYACGDNSSMLRSIATAVYTGNMAGAMVNMELTNEEF